VSWAGHRSPSAGSPSAGSPAVPPSIAVDFPGLPGVPYFYTIQ